jgi:TPR repeat protein
LIEAEKYFRLAAGANHVDTQVILGIFHFLGIGRCVDPASTGELFRMAADQENVHGQFNYAIAYFDVLGQIAVVMKSQNILNCPQI